jgi:hypothetical protein
MRLWLINILCYSLFRYVCICWFMYLHAYNSVQFCIIYMPSQQLQGQLQTQYNRDTSYGQTQHKAIDKLQASTGGKTH